MKKENPFEDKVKPAFEDLDDIDFGLDSDRHASNKPSPGKKDNKVGAGKKEEVVGKRTDTDNGLFADNDFGDDFEDDYEDDFDNDHGGNHNKDNNNIFENSRTKEA